MRIRYAESRPISQMIELKYGNEIDEIGPFISNFSGNANEKSKSWHKKKQHTVKWNKF